MSKLEKIKLLRAIEAKISKESQRYSKSTTYYQNGFYDGLFKSIEMINDMILETYDEKED